MSKTKIKFETIQQAEEARLERLKTKAESIEKELGNLQKEHELVQQKNMFANQVLDQWREKISNDQQFYESYMDQLQAIQEENINHEDHIKRGKLQPSLVLNPTS